MGRQFHNPDTGYGLGDCCANFIRLHRPFGEDPMSADEIERTYGRKGYHYEIERREMTPGIYPDLAWYEENDPQSLVDSIREHNSAEPKITDAEAVSMVNQANHEASGYPWF